MLSSLGQGYVKPIGPRDADWCFIGEAPGEDEAEASEPFVGKAGAKQGSIWRRLGLERDELRIHNVLSCRPPANKLSGAYYEQSAIRECRQYLGPVLNEPHKAFIALGAVPAKTLLGFKSSKHHSFKSNDWHGSLNWLDGRLVVPTYHPSFLMRGNQKLTGVVSWDIRRAMKAGRGQWQAEPAILRVDPELDWFTRWVDRYLGQVSSGLDTWLSIDIETVEKLSGKDESKLDGSNVQIVRINFSCHPDEGVTVPWLGEYLVQVRRLFASPGLKLMHNMRYDRPILAQAGFQVSEPLHDTMNMFKYQQSDLPQGLGFIAPFYSNYLHPEYMTTAWKHLAGSDPGQYAAIDAFQTLRIGYGLKKDLLKSGLWDTYQRHVYDLDTYVLHPAERVGLHVDSEKLTRFRAQLAEKELLLEAKIQAQISESERPLVGGAGNKGWKKPPKGLDPNVIIHKQVELEVWVCTDCGGKDVGEKHKCKRVKPPKTPKPRKKAGAKPSPAPGLPPGDGTVQPDLKLEQ